MKSTIIGEECVKDKPVFPCLRRSLMSKKIVLFTDVYTGTVLSRGNTIVGEIGFHYDNWMHFNDMDTWEPIKSITIKFEM